MKNHPPNERGKTHPASLASIAIGAVIFIGFAIRDPVFDNLLLDIPLYLAIGLAAVALLLATFWATATVIGRDRLARDQRMTRLGWIAGAVSFVIAVGAAWFVMTALQNA